MWNKGLGISRALSYCICCYFWACVCKFWQDIWGSMSFVCWGLQIVDLSTCWKWCSGFLCLRSYMLYLSSHVTLICSDDMCICVILQLAYMHRAATTSSICIGVYVLKLQNRSKHNRLNVHIHKRTTIATTIATTHICVRSKARHNAHILQPQCVVCCFYYTVPI